MKQRIFTFLLVLLSVSLCGNAWGQATMEIRTADELYKFAERVNNGEKTLNAAPVFGLLGYDTGMYFIDAMCDAKNDISKIDNNYDGIQSHFNFERTSNWSGYINKSVYIIHYTPSNDIEIEVK